LLRGQIISETDLEALEQFDLVKSQTRWQDLVSAAALAILTLVYFLVYLSRNSMLTQDLRGLAVIIVLFIVFLVGGRFVVTNQSMIPYIYPLAAFSLVVASLFGTKNALVFTLPLCVLYAYDTPNAFELTLFNLLGSYSGVFALGAARRMTSFFWAAALIAFSEIMLILAFRIPQPNADLINIAALVGIAVVNGIAASSLTVLLQYVLAQILGMTTALQLMEISRPDHPLLQFILRNAPGTYQHSLQVANLAEQAAEIIGADPLLTRVGAIYHDSGKAINPYFFIENQLPGNKNPHDTLDPVSSAQTIIRHVPDGAELARKHRLPRRIHDFIKEHHGTMKTRYQYAKAVEAADSDESLVDESQFSYPGPRPRSRETAILMLADGSEARVRAERPANENELRKVIKSVVEHRLSSGQLDETDLTLRDLDELIDSFTTTLRGIYHPRLEYPDVKKELPPKSKEIPTVPIISRKSSDVSANPRSDS
jgi:putative nucleotidyltransferase with HDIG domain